MKFTGQFVFRMIYSLLLSTSSYGMHNNFEAYDSCFSKKRVYSHSEVNLRPPYLLELSKKNYSIYLNNGGKYKVFDDCRAVGQCVLEWQSSQNDLIDEYLFTIQSKDSSVRLYSEHGEILEIELFKETNALLPITLFNLHNFYEAAIPVKIENHATTMQYSIQIVIPPHQSIGPGIYKCFLDVSLYKKNGKKINTQIIQLLVEVDASQKILIKSQNSSSPQSSINLDFGEVYATKTKNLVLQIQSNVNYQVSIQSMNGSKLTLAKNWNRSYYQCSSMPYDCYCDGMQFVLDKTSQKILYGYAKKNINICHYFSFTLYPDPKKNWEGLYEDEIIFSLQPIY